MNEAPNVTPKTAAREVRRVNMWRMVVDQCDFGGCDCSPYLGARGDLCSRRNNLILGMYDSNAIRVTATPSQLDELAATRRGSWNDLLPDQGEQAEHSECKSLDRRILI